MGTNRDDDDLAKEQKRAILFSKYLGKRVAKENPEVADGYRGGKTLIRLARESSSLEGISSDTVVTCAVHYALLELMSDDERKRIAHEHHVRDGKTLGTNAAKLHRERGTSIWKYTSEELSAFGKKAALALGNVVYSEKKKESEYGPVSEIEYAEKLRSSGFVWRVVAEKTNELFDNGRKSNVLSAHFSRKNRKAGRSVVG